MTSASPRPSRSAPAGDGGGPRVVAAAAELRAWRDALPPEERLGLVPTMGALHAGHAALIERARAECDRVAVSIFVNPAQFDEADDLAAYPRPLAADLERCAALGVDLVHVPDAADVYPAGFGTWVVPDALGDALEGACRPGHFRGVLTVVLKLLQRFRPHRAYFGEKDAQQAFLVRRMVRDLELAVEVVEVPTLREDDGLALSSRNVRLAPEDRCEALRPSRALAAAAAAFDAGERDPDALRAAMRAVFAEPGARARLEYAEVVGAADFRPASRSTPLPWRALVAARVGAVRLIDNRALAEPS